ncbi:MAG: hydroxymethylglutaryl-CoA lyase [Lautropia sp. SCN 66-9]|nr:MAG: hydroxymethylglutaryl-CoA lyase [Lautropia sp. SCN 66-9]
MSDLPRRVRINEEGPREGFQIERNPIPTARKIELIDALSLTGVPQIQVVSFVSPSAVPGMADAEQVVAGFTRRTGVIYTGLWLNEKGLLRALAANKLDIRGSLALTASERFLLRNQKRTPDEDLAAQHSLIAMYRAHEVPVVRAGIMAAFGCNFEGDVPLARVLGLVDQIRKLSATYGLRLETLSLADTMAWATPAAIRRVVGAVREAHPELRLSLHLHDTRGCPFAAHAGAAGNVCTEDLVFMCHEMGIETGIDLDALIEAARLAEDIVGHPLPGSMMRGGTLDRLRAKARAAAEAAAQA